jgi:asparagine synthase (glutamine-hydrolysing)
MSVALSHRGPICEGFFDEPELCLSIGQRRLDNIRGKTLHAGPVISANKRYVLSFDGAIYNHMYLRMETQKHGGADCLTASDEESFIEAIATLGFDKTIELSLGAFASCLYDKVESCLYLVRDRAGEKPLYYGTYKDAFFFTSDLIALRAAGIDLPLDRRALQLYCDHGYYPAPWTVFEGVYKLKAAHILRVNLPFSGVSKPKPYWDINELVRTAYDTPFSGSAVDAVEELAVLLNDSVRTQMEYAPAGAFLSGGIDSSLITSLMQSLSTKPIKTFTIGFNEFKKNEAHFAKETAKYLGTDHSELYITDKDALDVIPLLPAVYTEPFADSSQIPTYFVNKIAKEHVPAALVGDAGDELFGGYPKYLGTQAVWVKAKKIPMRFFLGEMALRIGAFGFSPNKDKLFRGAKLLKSRSNLQAYEALVRQWNWCPPLVLGASECENVLNDPELSDAHTSMIFMMMDADFRMYLPDDGAVKVERAAAAAGLMICAPLLDKRVIEFAYRLPVDIKINEGIHKWPLKQVLYRFLPEKLIERPKQGFAIPVRE